jgi:hypothetical protein
MESNDELHQMHAITTLQNISIEQISFIHHQMDESTFDYNLIHWDDDSTEDEVSDPNSSVIETQRNDENQDNLGKADPVQGT